MKLVDVMSSSGLTIYAIVALVLFVGAFVAVVALTFGPSSSARHERAARLPFDDDANGSVPRTGEE